jgi:hypothetical protein
VNSASLQRVSSAQLERPTMPAHDAFQLTGSVRVRQQHSPHANARTPAPPPNRSRRLTRSSSRGAISFGASTRAAG